jgi:hypothetical protein
MGRKRTGKTYGDQMRGIADKYMEAVGQRAASTHDMARWAIDKGLWQPHPSAIVDRCAEDLARAMREDYITDPQGRRVRAKHAARVTKGGKQMTLWADIHVAPREHMAVAFQQRRQQIVGDCWQLKQDVDSFNDNVRPVEPIQAYFDFTEDLEEMEAVA